MIKIFSYTDYRQYLADIFKEYKKVKVTEQADKAAIKKALQNGEVIEGCEIIESSNLKIN